MDSKDVSEDESVKGWFEMGQAWLDEKYGVGFALKNPALLAAYVQACALQAVRTALTDELINGLAGVERAAGRSE